MTDETPQTDDEIRRAAVDRVREVQIPGGDPVAEGLLEDVSVDSGVVTFTVNFSRLDQDLSDRVTDQIQGAGLATEGVEHARVEAADPGAPADGLPVTGTESILAIGSAKGGVGKTTVTVALARALDQAGLDVGIFDANVHAPDAPDLLGADGPIRQTPTGRPMPAESDGIEVVSLELIAEQGPNVWRGAMIHDAVKDLLGNAAWDDRDVLLVDLPPGIGDAVYTIVQQAPIDGALFVGTPTEAGARGVDRMGSLFDTNDVPTIGVVPNMVGSTDGPAPFDDDESIFEGERTEDAYATIDPIPFDRSLRTPMACSFDDPETDGERAIVSLRKTVEAFLADARGPAVPEDAVDLRGLPPETRRRHAVTEVGSTRAGDVSILTRGEPDDLIDVVEETLERGGDGLRGAEVVDLDRDGWLIEFEPDLSTTSVSERAA